MGSPPWYASAWIWTPCRVISFCFAIGGATAAWDHGGFWVLYKRLERGTFAWPSDDDGDPVTMRSGDLGLLLAGIDLTHPRRRRWYEPAA
jgi:transposase